MYLHFGACWTLGEPVARNQLEDDPDRLVEDRAGNDNVELERGAREVRSRCITQENTPDQSAVVDDVFGDFEEVSPDYFEVNHPVHLVDPRTVPSLQPGQVYRLDEEEYQEPRPRADSRVMARAARLSLPPQQEHMRLPIARSLVGSKPRSPKKRRKIPFLGNVLKRL